MTYTKMDNILKRNALKEQEDKTSYQQQTNQSKQPIQEQRPELQERHDESQQHFFSSSIPIPSLGLFDTSNPVYAPEDEAFRRRLQQKKKKKKCQDFKKAQRQTPFCLKVSNRFPQLVIFFRNFANQNESK